MTSPSLDASRVEGALLRYRVAAIVVGVSILVLVCIGIPLDKGAGHPGLDQSLGFVHGVFFYPIYVLLTLDLARRTRMHPVQVVLTVVFGTVPVLSFYAEHRATQFVRGRLTAPTDESVD